MYRIGPIGRKSNFHSKEKCLIGLVLVTLCLLCFGGIFLLPDNFGGDRVLRVYKQFKKSSPEIFIPAPPLAAHAPKDLDPHFMNDRVKLQTKIKEELGEIMDKPQLQQDTIDSGAHGDQDSPQQFDDNDMQQGAAPPLNNQQPKTNDNNHSPDDVAALDNNNLPIGNFILQMPFGGHADTDASVEDKRLKVKEICDNKTKIMYVDARHPGANHDAFVWEHSTIDQKLRNNFEGGKKNTWILGDGGYKLKPYLMTPFRKPRTVEERRYNNKHTSTRNVVERCFGILKNRFRSIIGSRGLHYEPKKVTQIVNACCALHNMCLFFGCEEPTVDLQNDTTNDTIEDAEEDVGAMAIRRNIALNL